MRKQASTAWSGKVANNQLYSRSSGAGRDSRKLIAAFGLESILSGCSQFFDDLIHIRFLGNNVVMRWEKTLATSLAIDVPSAGIQGR